MRVHLFIVGFFLAFGTSNFGRVTDAAEKPNVLFISIDDMNDWTTLFDESHPIQTPNLKRLAERGCFFSRAYPLEATQLPPMPEGDLDDVGEIARRMVGKEHFVFDNTTAAKPGSPGSLQRMVQCYQAAADFSDQMVGRLIDKLDETGLSENTIIVLWSDHGYHLGDKKTCVKFTLWEKANRVPFIIVAPGVTTPGSRCDRPLSLVDIYPTLVELAGLPANPENDGLSLVSLLKDPTQSWRRPALMTEGPGNHAVRSSRWRYIRYSDGAEELYDHESDPWEHDNLASQERFAGVLAEHRKWLPAKEAPGKGMNHLYDPAPPIGARLSGGN